MPPLCCHSPSLLLPVHTTTMPRQNKTHTLLAISMLPATLLVLVSLVVQSSALEVATDSPCSNFCIDSPRGNISEPRDSATFSDDLSCRDSDYNGINSTAVGRKFQSCVGCEQYSSARGIGTGKGAGQSTENDVYWFLCKSFSYWIFLEKRNRREWRKQAAIAERCS